MGLSDMLGRLSGVRLGALDRLKDLSRGNSQAQVLTLLGRPARVQQFEEKLVWTYSLHQWMKGMVPCHLVFEGSDGPLTAWMVDEAQYERNQQQWMAAITALESATGGGAGSSSGNSLNADIAANIAWKASGAGKW